MTKRIVFAALSLSLFARTWDASAQAASAFAPSTPSAALEELKLRVRALEAERDATRKAQATATAVAVGASGVTFRAPDGSVQARFRGYVQEDGGSVDTDTNAGKDVAGRVFVQPFLDSGIGALRGLGFGVGASRGRQDQATPTATGLAGYRTPIQQSFFSYRSDGTAAGTALADGARVRIAPQGYYYLGPIGVQSEYVTSTQHIRRGGASADLKHSAWQVAGSVVLTGEKASLSGVRPRHDFAPARGSLGALQLASRVDRQDQDDAAFPLFADPARAARSAHAWAVGLNWYLNQNVKFVVDYERTGFQGGSAAGDRATESGIVSRVQLSF